MENNKLLKEQRRAKITKMVGLSVVGAIVLGTGATILTCHLINEWKYKTGINKIKFI